MKEFILQTFLLNSLMLSIVCFTSYFHNAIAQDAYSDTLTTPRTLTPDDVTAIRAAMQQLGISKVSLGAEASMTPPINDSLLLPLIKATDSLRNSTLQMQAAGAFTESMIPSAFYPIGSGDNLNEFKKRVKAVKEWYKEVRTYLSIDDIIRIEGYLNTITGLEITFLAAFPVAELSFGLTLLALAAQITNAVSQSLGISGTSHNLAANIITLKIALSAQARYCNDTKPTPDFCISKESSPVASSTRSGTTTASSDFYPTVALEGVGAGGISVNSLQLSQNLIKAAESVNSELLPWATSGGPVGVMNLATDILGAAFNVFEGLQKWAINIPSVG